ncbi:MAG: family 16 glycoside hydrolase, partial [Planctomycetota bacterium]
LERQTEEHKRSELQRKSASRLPGDFTRDEWHTYKVVRKDKRIVVYLDGKEVFSFAGADRTLDGFLGIWAQDSLVEIRKIALLR